jgi:hypothetical protein
VDDLPLPIDFLSHESGLIAEQHGHEILIRACILSNHEQENAALPAALHRMKHGVECENGPTKESENAPAQGK